VIIDGILAKLKFVFVQSVNLHIGIGKKMIIRNNKGQFIKGSSNPWNKRKKCPQLSIVLRGRNAWNKNKKCPQLSKKRNPNWRGGLLTRYCLVCNKKYKIILARRKTNKFCSLHCVGIFYGNQKIGENSIMFGKIPYNKGKKMPLEFRLKISGFNSPNWRGGITPVNKHIRNSLGYKLWRTAIFDRDNYTCIWCGERGGKLNADHIKPFSLFPELRFVVTNGRTLCEDCHKKTDSYLVNRAKLERLYA